jgi:hypothetical protein
MVDLVALGEQQLDHRAVQVKLYLHVTLDGRRAEVEDYGAGARPHLEAVRAGPVAQLMAFAEAQER